MEFPRLGNNKTGFKLLDSSKNTIDDGIQSLRFH